MANLITYDGQTPVARGDGIESIALTPRPFADQGFIMGTTAFPPGTGLRLHYHNCIEQVTVLEGEAMAELDGRQFPVGPYDTTQVPAGESHRFVNVGDGVMRILWVYGAVHVTRTFPDTGETVDQFHPQ